MAKARALPKAAGKSDGKPHGKVSRTPGDAPRAAKPLAPKKSTKSRGAAPAKSREAAPARGREAAELLKARPVVGAQAPEPSTRPVARAPRAVVVEPAALPEIPPPLPAPIASFTF